MTGLLRAELRKTTSTKVWWALLVPAVLVALLVSLGGSALAGLPSEEDLESIGGAVPPVLGLTYAVSVGFASIFVLSLGIIGTAGENRHRTITTTYLTAPGRGHVLGAKLAVHAGLGALYGVAVLLASLLGGVLGGGSAVFPPALQLLGTAVLGVLALVLWALLGVGIGALVSNQVVALVGALVGTLVVEAVVSAVLTAQGAQDAARFLPSAASSELVQSTALRGFAAALPRSSAAGDLLAGTTGGTWWVGGLVLAAWAGAFAAAGWLVTRERDVG